MLILKGAVLRALAGNVRVVYLTGSEGQCLDAFLARERQSGRGLTALHWAQNNQAIYEFLKTTRPGPTSSGRSTRMGRGAASTRSSPRCRATVVDAAGLFSAATPTRGYDSAARAWTGL